MYFFFFPHSLNLFRYLLLSLSIVMYVKKQDKSNEKREEVRKRNEREKVWRQDGGEKKKQGREKERGKNTPFLSHKVLRLVKCSKM